MGPVGFNLKTEITWFGMNLNYRMAIRNAVFSWFKFCVELDVSIVFVSGTSLPEGKLSRGMIGSGMFFHRYIKSFFREFNQFWTLYLLKKLKLLIYHHV